MKTTNDYMNKVIRQRDSNLGYENVIFRWKNGRVIPIFEREYKIPNELILKEYNKKVNKYTDNRFYLATISPDDYLKLVTTNSIYGTSVNDLIEENKNRKFETNAKTATDKSYIMLGMNMQTGQVTRHEGRHRMLGLKDMNYKKVQIIVFPDTGSEFKEQTYRTVKNQYEENGFSTYFEKMIPVNEEYINKIKK